MVPNSARKEFRTTVILTEAQVRRIREVAMANDASIAWVVRQAVDRHLAAKSRGGRGGKATRHLRAGKMAK
jgi:hypothetical protein